MKTPNEKILWLDCLGGLFVGTVVLFFCRPLSDWENLPISVVVSMGLVNLFYGGCSLYITTRKPRPLLLVKALALANVLWLLVCVVVAACSWREISSLGLLHVIGEGIYVAALGITEWKWQLVLSDPIPRSSR